MNVLSLFDGISCGKLALEKVGIKPNNYFASEIDSNAISVSKYNYPSIIQIGDVSKVNYKNNILYTENGEFYVDNIDLLIGGSPCQGFSRNGLGLNFNDKRSKLFFEFVRILKEVKPKYFLLENVKMKKEYEKIISNYLEVDPIEINSKLLSAQNRERLYWTNIPNVTIPMDKGIKLIDILEEVDTFNFINYKGLLVDNKYRKDEIDLIDNVNEEVRIKQNVKKGYIVANNGDGINLTFPKSKTRRGRVIKSKSSCLDCSCDIGVYYNGIIRKFTLTELEKLQTIPIGYTKCLNESNRKKCIGNGWTVDIIAHIFKGLKIEE